MRKELLLSDYLDGFKRRDRTVLARAITLVESSNLKHQDLAQELLRTLLPLTGNSRRIGISGTPGVGKSTFIETYGKLLTQAGKTIAVLAVDPTSKISGGSILGDKTRMNELAIDPMAFIRPSPSGETLGGVARRTRESLLLCEAFGFDYVLIETVGVGQSETQVAQMVDLFVMLLQPGAGDDLQGIKRGILELVDMVIVTKDDGDQKKIIERARHDYEHALQILRHDSYVPPVLSCSSITKKGFSEFQNAIDSIFKNKRDQILDKRKTQGLDWMWQLVFDRLREEFKKEIGDEAIKSTEAEVLSNQLTAVEAANRLMKNFRHQQ